MRLLLSGNEAIARGCYEAGVTVACGYPGTPSTEILETIVRWPEVHAQWSPNEKVALEVALGAAVAGVRALVTMKHVGLNVAADPLFTAAYTGVNGGLVVVVADDPGMHSSQNEQDSRHYARSAKVPMLEPSDSAEARTMAMLAFEISERFDTPVLLRSSTRVSHSKSPVSIGARIVPEPKPFRRDPRKYVMVPANARDRRRVLEQRLQELVKFSEQTEVNRAEYRDLSLGIVTSGVSYQYVREALPNASVLKLGMVHPLPASAIREFASRVQRLCVVEELDPFLEEQIRAFGIPVEGKSLIPMYGELDPDTVAKAFGANGSDGSADSMVEQELPARPPVMCPGCPHRAVFFVLSKINATVFGDIGCYTLGVAPPLSAMHSCVCMGAGVGMALGAQKARLTGPVVAVIGDSTFVHSGITPLIDIVYNRGAATVLILDNRTTAMTGRQDHPATGRTLSGEETHELDLAGLAEAVGVKHVQVVDPYDLYALEQAIRRAVNHPAPSVVVVKRACALADRSSWKAAMHVDADLCTSCGLCGRLGCPALRPPAGRDSFAVIDPILCTGCGVCAQLCPYSAIGWPGID
ncbi:MAG: indolepyruvate ferredoxin oxidoreductase subunit alpha [Armatimonadota bacterium]